MLGDDDRQESGEEVQAAVSLLLRSRGRFVSFMELPSPAPGSVLERERRATAYEPIHTIALRQRSRAVDNLGRTFDLMLDEHRKQVVAYPYSLYSLIRAAVESAGLTLWLMRPNTRASRVLRSLQLTYRDTNERLQFVELLGNKGEIAKEHVRHDQIEDRLIELKNSVATLKQRTLDRPPKYGAILESLSKPTTTGGVAHYDLASPLMIWKISTAFIHGSDQVTRALSDFRQLTDFEDGMAQVEMMPSLQMLAGCIHATVGLIEQVDERYLELATRDYQGRSVV